MATTDEEKAKLLATLLESTFEPHADIEDAHFSAEVHEYLIAPNQLSLPPQTFKKDEVSQIIKHLPLKKAPGYDLLTATILK